MKENAVFESRLKQPPYSQYHNDLIQKETVFKNASQKLAYLYLHSYANAKKIFPSMKSIAIAICSSERNAMRVIEQLEELKFIEVSREAGKSNNYILNDYFEVVTNCHQSESPDPRQNVTSDKLSPVTESHPTSDKLSPVEPKPVTICHPKTSSLKTINKISLVPSLETINGIVNLLKSLWPNAPIDKIVAEMIEEAESEDSKIEVKTPKQFKGLLNSRVERWNATRTTKPAQFKPKAPIRTEHTPEWFVEAENYYAEPKEDDSVKKALIGIKLKLHRGEELSEEEEMLWEIQNRA